MAVPQVFLSHLHSDHHADLASLYVNAMFGRKVPLEIWGPSSEKPELGLAASIEGLRQVGSLCLCAVAAVWLPEFLITCTEAFCTTVSDCLSKFYFSQWQMVQSSKCLRTLPCSAQLIRPSSNPK